MTPNLLFCKDPKLVNANDFFFSGLQNPRNTQNPLGSNVTAVNVDNLLGLNTLGISLARIDFAPNGLNPPHTHPRATEILVVLEGTLYVGFVTSNGDGNRLFTKVLNKGDVFVFPIGHHFQLRGKSSCSFAGLSSRPRSDHHSQSSVGSQLPSTLMFSQGLPSGRQCG
ncbi:germin-like protein subfamily 1 member 11 isoform X2 [Prunus yedoensis var. nudiflora]|uniref:Germin-like protein n=1 Tax=Prunus yedoensis var. nudiflora TaxID=2094558 RepID=A0A314YJ86_PRUYE|nr:germin-like protein subfamily 1 member 11 isoform X2 [Prunus yedoensis var. nudiflora]